MPNLVGIGNSQVPTNAMLGGLAYQDSVGEINIDKIKAKLSDDVSTGTYRGKSLFVYDTRKDSDGGAWRKRTSHTSWYNEPPSATRGARKEFPSVAIIAFDDTTPDSVTIYDGDDPNLPMWMIFNSVYSGSNYGGLINILSVGSGGIFALNGTVVGGRSFVSFIDDNLGGYWWTDGFYRNSGEGIVNRNVLYPHTKHNSVGVINGTIYDVAMTVLPDSPIDSGTGLPTPTIAFGTNGGLCVTYTAGDGGFKESNIYDLSGFAPVDTVDFSDDKLLIHVLIGTTTYAAVGRRKLTADIDLNFWEFGDQWNTGHPEKRANLPKSMTKALLTKNNKLVFGGASAAPVNNVQYLENRGIFQIQMDAMVEENGDQSFNKCEITSTYNTGWMHGNTRRTNLATTNTSSVLSSTNLISNGNFSNGTTGWAAHRSDASNVNSLSVNGSGQAVWTVTAGSYWFYQDVTSQVTAGKTYMVTATLVSRTTTAWIRVGSGNGGSGDLLDQNNWSSNGTATDYFFTVPVGWTNNVYVQFGIVNGGNTLVIDDVVLSEADPERAYNGKNTEHLGLRTYGTINRNPVATGAELVAYSNWSASNYLIGRYFDSDDDPGGGDHSVKAWVKISTDHVGIIWSIRNPATGSTWLQLWFNTSNLINYGSNSAYLTTTFNIVDGNWHCLYGVKSSSAIKLYVDGVEIASTSTTGSDPGLDPNSTFRIGNHYDTNHPLQGSLALISYEMSAPSAEMIKRIYEEEKLLFRKDAKCTLYGTSDIVTAIAKDDVTDTLHVGTSSGRSEFRGLNRINNTTTAVTTAISASDGLVAEQ